MKTILWLVGDNEITFTLNWLEWFFLKRIIKKRRYKINQNQIKGKKFDGLIVDEWCKLNLDLLKK